MKLRCYNCLINQKLFSQIRSVIFHALSILSIFTQGEKMSVVQIILFSYFSWKNPVQPYLWLFPIFFHCVLCKEIMNNSQNNLLSKPSSSPSCFEFMHSFGSYSKEFLYKVPYIYYIFFVSNHSSLFLTEISMYCIHSGPENLKSPGQKTREIK